MTGPELEAILFEHMPESFFARLLRATFAAHRDAAEECGKNFRPTEIDNILGLYRRAKLEGYMRDAADMEGIPHKVARSRMSNWNHTEVRKGPVILTASTVQTPCDLVEEADFRNTLARSNEQVLWAEPDDEAEAPLYVLLLHSRSRWPKGEQPRYSYLPGSAYLAFPLPDLSGYAHDIDLFEKFPDVVDSLLPREWDTEAKVRYLFYAHKAATA